ENFIEEHLNEAFRHTSRQDKPLKYTVFVRFDCMKEQLSEAIKSQCIAYDEPIDPLYLFLKKAVKKDMLFVFHLHISKTGRPDTDYLANELKYVSHYALH
ncbi:PilZ domain-containing protein, partial [Pseudoalteromonas ruthenica]